MTINTRTKGCAYERQIAKELRELLDKEDIYTSRSESKRLDDAGVDLTGVPMFHIQAKAWEKAPAYHDVLAKMPKDGKYNCIFHKRNRKGDVVVLSKADFYEILLILKNENLL